VPLLTKTGSIRFVFFIAKYKMAKNVIIKSTETVSANFFSLEKIHFEIEKNDGTKEELTREVYHTADGVTVLLFNKEKKTVVLTRQFRIATYINNNQSGMLIEACAGIKEDENEHEAMVREIEEETGFRVENVKKIFELYSTPGCNTEKVYYFIAEYADKQKVAEGGGLEEEQEEIDVLEMPFKDAWLKMETGEIKDAKTVILLQYAKAYHLFAEEKVFDVL
jgi:nudix-type nucleoside diphosphatase (YffH/AdpP family)